MFCPMQELGCSCLIAYKWGFIRFLSPDCRLLLHNIIISKIWPIIKLRCRSGRRSLKFPICFGAFLILHCLLVKLQITYMCGRNMLKNCLWEIRPSPVSKMPFWNPKTSLKCSFNKIALIKQIELLLFTCLEVCNKSKCNNPRKVRLNLSLHSKEA